MWRDELIRASREDLIECIMEQRHIVEHLERRIIQLERCSNNNMYREESRHLVNDNFTDDFVGKEYFTRRCTSCRELPSMCKFNISNKNNNNTSSVINSNRNFMVTKNNNSNNRPLHTYREERTYKQSDKELQNVARYSVANPHNKTDLSDEHCNTTNDNNNTNNINIITPLKQSNHVYNVHKYTEELDVEDGIKEIERVLRLHNAGKPRLPNGVVAELLYILRKLRESEGTLKNNSESAHKIEEEEMQQANIYDSNGSIADRQVELGSCRQTPEQNDNDGNSRNCNMNSRNVGNVEHRLSFRTPINSKEFITLHRPRTNVWASANEHPQERCKREYYQQEDLPQQRRSLFVNTPFNRHLSSNSSQAKQRKTPTIREEN